MTVTTDYDKMLQAVSEEDAPPIGLLAVPSDWLARNSGVNDASGPMAIALTFRMVPGAPDEVLAGLTSHLLRCLSLREEELGGDGLAFDVGGSTFGPDRVVLRLVPNKRDGAPQRLALLLEEMNSERQRAREGACHAEGGIGEMIDRNFKSALPESAMKQLELAAVA